MVNAYYKFKILQTAQNLYRVTPVKHIGENTLLNEIFKKSSSVVFTELNGDEDELIGFSFDVDASLPYRSKGIFQLMEQNQFGYVKSNIQDEVIVFENSGFLQFTAFAFNIPYIETQEVFDAYMEGAFDKDCWDILATF